ncbi:MAG: hypothetical protein WAT09_15975 [Paracoccaceae bacterium]
MWLAFVGGSLLYVLSGIAFIATAVLWLRHIIWAGLADARPG